MRQTAFALAIALVLGVSSALAQGFESDVDTIQIISANVGGKNVFIPSTIVVTSGTCSG